MQEGVTFAVRHLLETIADGVEPDAVTYNSLISACLPPEQLDIACFFLAFQYEAGLARTDSFNITLRCAMQSFDFRTAKEILQDMEVRKLDKTYHVQCFHLDPMVLTTLPSTSCL